MKRPDALFSVRRVYKILSSAFSLLPAILELETFVRLNLPIFPVLVRRKITKIFRSFSFQLRFEAFKSVKYSWWHEFSKVGFFLSHQVDQLKEKGETLIKHTSRWIAEFRNFWSYSDGGCGRLTCRSVRRMHGLLRKISSQLVQFT